MGPSIAVGLQINTQPPLAASRAVVLAVRAMGLESVMLIDHFQNVFPRNRGGSHESPAATRQRILSGHIPVLLPASGGHSLLRPRIPSGPAQQLLPREGQLCCAADFVAAGA